MNPLPMPASLAPRAATAQAGTAGPESPGEGAGFAAALDLAREPAGSAQKCRLEVDADANAIEDGPADGSEHGDAAERKASELSALLPGWPPAAWPIAAPAPSAATASAQQDAPDAGTALPALAPAMRLDTFAAGRLEPRTGHERWRSNEASPAASPAEPIAVPGDKPAPPRATAAPAADAAAKSDSAAIAAPTPLPPVTPTTSASAGGAAFSGGLGSTAASAAAPPFEARLAAAIDSAAFAPALAKQVTWLAGEGVQQARIHLNPAEMGPLSVKILLDGTQARIDFSADLAATRGAIEASLPTLAAALHDQGLTLAGGGVSDGQARHGTPRDRAAPWAQADSAAASVPHTPGGLAGAQPLRATRGLVDLVA